MTKSKLHSKRNLLLNFSLWILVGACILLLLLLTLFAVSNYKREKALIVEALAQKGSTLMRFMDSSVRESVRDSLRFGNEWNRWQDHMQTAMEQAIEQPGVELVLLVDTEGNILTLAGLEPESMAIDQETRDFVATIKDADPRKFTTRIFRTAKGDQKFQIAAHYRPPNMVDPMHSRPGRGKWRGQMMQRFSSHPQFDMIQKEITELLNLKPIYIIQLDIDQFNSPLRRQVLQIIILTMVIILVGIGGVLSFATLKGLKGSQSRLDQMRAFTDILVSSLPLGLIATDSHGAVRICNSAARKLLGIDEEKILGLMPQSCLPLEFSQLFSGKEPDDFRSRQQELQFSTDTKKVKTLQLATVFVKDEIGNFAGEVLLIRDLTNVKHLEKELQRSERLAALGKMAAGVAHELRNPLSSIKGLALILKSSFSIASKEAETADILVKEVERLNRSIGELLDYAKPGGLKRELTSIEDIIGKTVSLVQLDADSFGISIKLEIDKELPLISIDRDKMNQVFLNLFLNAIQAMGHGGELIVRTEKSGQTIIISIRDNGVGIDSENLARVFDPYFTTKSQGTGLGLSMSSKIVEEHGGRLELSSIPGEYTEARVFLSLSESG